jgi:hypothetical protein
VKKNAKQILSTRCPTCGSKPGQACELNTGQPRNTPHRDRRLAAQAEGVSAAPLPERIIDKGLVSDRVVIDTLVSGEQVSLHGNRSARGKASACPKRQNPAADRAKREERPLPFLVRRCAARDSNCGRYFSPESSFGEA